MVVFSRFFLTRDALQRKVLSVLILLLSQSPKNVHRLTYSTHYTHTSVQAFFCSFHYFITTSGLQNKRRVTFNHVIFEFVFHLSTYRSAIIGG